MTAASASAYIRPSGRRHDQLRTLLCERTILHRADGSAKWSQDGTSILAAVYGPRQAGIRKEDAEKAVLEVNFRPRIGLPGTKEHEIEHTIRRTVEAAVLPAIYPRTSISIILQVIQDDGALLACALNVVCAALVDAAIPMSSLFGAVGCAVMGGTHLVMDPDGKEEQEATAVATFAYTYNSDLPPGKEKPAPLVVSEDVLTCITEGPLEVSELFKAAEICRQGMVRVGSFARSSLLKAFVQNKALVPA